MGLKSRYPVPFLMGQNPKQYKMWWTKVIDLKLTYLIGLLSSVNFFYVECKPRLLRRAQCSSTSSPS